MARVLVTEEIADSGLQKLRDAGHEVDIQLGLSPEALLGAVRGAHALIIRSATNVDAATLEAASDMIVVGRAGIGLDNVDVTKATELGVMVVNAPVSNILSAAEQTMALLLSQARNIPQAHSALKNGKWERSKWEGVELHGKTLGVIGLGKIGALVAQRANAFGMRLVAYDPYISEERARHMGIELMDLETLLGQSDFITIHLPKNKETTDLLNAESLKKTKKGVRIINVARGGIVNEADLAEAIKSGHVQGAALDVFAKEPTTESPLFELPSVVVVPHLGASTAEAQDKAGITIAEQVELALAGDFVPYAVNVSAGEVSNSVSPYMGLAELLGRFIGGLLDGKPADLEVTYHGELAGAGTKILTLCALKGLLSSTGHDGVSFVNAPQLAADHNLTFGEVSSMSSAEYVSLITVSSDGHTVSGTLMTIGTRVETRIVSVDGHAVEIAPASSMLVVHNDDRPGMIGQVGLALGAAGISIASMAVGPDPKTHTALMVLSTLEPTPAAVLEQLRDTDGIERHPPDNTALIVDHMSKLRNSGVRLVLGTIVTGALTVAPLTAALAASTASAQSMLSTALKHAVASGWVHEVITTRKGTVSETMVNDIGTSEGRQTVAFSTGAKAEVIAFDAKRKLYVQGNELGCSSYFGFSKKDAIKFANKWLLITPSSGGYKTVAVATTLASDFGVNLNLDDAKYVGGVTTLDGVSVQEISGVHPAEDGAPKFAESLYVTVKGSILPVALKSKFDGYTITGTWAHWGHAVQLNVPSGAVPIPTS